MLASISANLADVNTPAAVDDAAPIATLVPSDEFIVTFVVDVVLDKSVLTLVFLAVFASISSNNSGDNKPETDVVAIGIIAFAPSEETIVLAPVVPVMDKSVLTFVFLALFAVIADA